jgi:very-short-patch-repair endonuclease
VRLADIERIRNIAQFLKGEMERLPTPLHGDGLTLCHALLTDPDLRSFLRRLADSAQGAGRLRETLTKYPATLERLGIAADLRGFSASRLAKMAESEFALLVRYVSLAQELRQTFRQIPEVNYAAEQERVQDLVTVYMTYLMDGRVIEFYDNQKNIARSLRDIIRSKQRFPQTEFRTLKDAFPCILAGIRDYAEYIPFEPEIFDLLIIDEASQVSIAQAFPALLRARKILILGDKKQFSNVKAGQARGDTNREYMNRLEATFRQHVSRDPAKVVKLARFDIRTSILEFFEYISNYQARLLKHFRSYKELISYSNAKFYRNLQVMKIRGKSIDDVIQFTILPPSPGGPAPKNRNTNQQEAQFIISELLKLKEEGSKASVGIITPHTDQQKLLVDAVGRLPERDFLYSEFRLKIMTFDTCQGEERDLVFYSMVATGSSDKLWGVFIKDLASVDLEEDGKLKAQRLNVGFSRARECVHFVLSKPLDGYSGAIGEALRHFWSVRDEAKKEHAAAEVDPRSAREAAVLTWFYQTRFWNEEKDRIEFTPQFKLGKYLKQFDSYYSHPEYRVDFLLLYRPAASAERKIIIEYDGFREHFGEGIGIDAANYADYYSEEDVYRQKLLESYGYKFLRINRFNLGDDPIATLDGRLRRLLGKQPDLPHNDVLETIHSDIRQLQEGGLKECPKCKELRTTEEFKDASLASGVGRFCRSCKGVKRVRPARVSPSPTLTSPGPNPCPKCGSRMVLRTGRFGKFYGCSKYPYCRAIRPFAASTAGRTG